ncbi:MAG: nuclear transport factor 2 family protein [Sphingomicrobium sp.]
MRPLLLIAATAIALAACQKGPSGQPAVTAAEAERVAVAAEATFTTGDVGAIMDQYANGAEMIDASSPDPSGDRKIQTGWARAFTSMKPADYKVSGRRIQLLGGDAFVSSGIESFTVAAGAGRPTVSARFTDVFQRQSDGKWKIVAEHVSMPPVAPPAP